MAALASNRFVQVAPFEPDRGVARASRRHARSHRVRSPSAAEYTLYTRRPMPGRGESAARGAGRGGAQPSRRILLVDDDTDLLAVSGDILRDAGFDVVTSTDGSAAISALASGRFDAVISDVRMPGLDGLGLLRAVRERDPDLPVVLTTSDPSLEGVSEALAHGALHYLIKPVALERLVETARRAVRLGVLARFKRDALRSRGEDMLLAGDRGGLETAFARALRSLHMPYQPIVRADGSRFGCEAPVRCREPLFPHANALPSAAGMRVSPASRRWSSTSSSSTASSCAGSSGTACAAGWWHRSPTCATSWASP